MHRRQKRAADEAIKTPATLRRGEQRTVGSGSPVTAEDLKAFCLAKGPAYSHPRFIDIVAALPLNGAGKIDRGAVAAKLSAAYGSQRGA